MIFSPALARKINGVINLRMNFDVIKIFCVNAFLLKSPYFKNGFRPSIQLNEAFIQQIPWFVQKVKYRVI
jgi:hypothetical protein